MGVRRFFNRHFHSPAFRLGAVLLVALAWGTPAFCGDIQKAIKKGDVEKVKALLLQKPDLVSSKSGLLGATPLETAAYYGQKEIAEVLIANHADVNAKDHLGFTPLMEAAMVGSKDVAQVLLVNGADVNAKNKSGETALWLANNGNHAHSEVADVLRLFGATK
jgi:ankyrin repeat protein